MGDVVGRIGRLSFYFYFFLLGGVIGVFLGYGRFLGGVELILFYRQA